MFPVFRCPEFGSFLRYMPMYKKLLINLKNQRDATKLIISHRIPTTVGIQMLDTQKLDILVSGIQMVRVFKFQTFRMALGCFPSDD